MKRFILLLVVLAVLPHQSLAADAKPNLIFILVDDLRFDALACAGHPCTLRCCLQPPAQSS